MEQIASSRAWTFPPALIDALAAFGARFGAPFWASFEVHGGVRTVTRPDGTTITETLTREWATGYEYDAAGVSGIASYHGTFVVTGNAEATTLTWTTSFEAADVAAAAYMLDVIAGAGQRMFAGLASHFTPVPQ